ncbi:MAG: DUF3108 domain-containing protein [Thermoanaerobaculales bacterium]
MKLLRYAGYALAVLLVVGIAAIDCRAEPDTELAGRAGRFIPLDGPYAYKVEYLGLKCGHVTLQSSREVFEGRPAYHIVMTVRNSKFFNRIYKVHGRIESWIDAETLSTLAFESVIVEKGKTRIKRFHIDPEAGEVTAETHGEITTTPYDGGPALDPLAFVFRSRLLAATRETTFRLILLTEKGPVETISQVGELKRFRTFEGEKKLLRVQPMTIDAEMFSRKGELVMWIDPGGVKLLHRLDFKLGFGRLVAKLVGPAPAAGS